MPFQVKMFGFCGSNGDRILIVRIYLFWVCMGVIPTVLKGSFILKRGGRCLMVGGNDGMVSLENAKKVYKILLVDDVQLFIEIEKVFLEMSPVEVFTARDGVGALEIVRREHPDLVVMDINMPRMDGIECCAAIKNDPAFASIPVIMVTNAGRPDDLQQSRQAGCDDFILKPVNGRSFLDKARRFLNVIDRRKKRVAFDADVEIQMDGRLMSGTAVDLCCNGIYVALQHYPEIGDGLTCSFRLLESESVMTVARGRVAWVNYGDERIKSAYPPGFGVEFLEIIGEGLPMLRVSELRSFIDLRK